MSNPSGVDGAFFFEETAGGRQHPISLGVYCPLLGGTRPPSVGAKVVPVALELTITDADGTANTFTVPGDYSAELDTGKTFTVDGSTGGTNDGAYTSLGAVFGGTNTVVTVTNVPADDTVGSLFPDLFAVRAIRKPCYLSGPQQVVNNHATEAVEITFWDGEPSDADSVPIQSISVNALSKGSIDLAGTVLICRHGLWLEASGVAADVSARLLLNY